MLASTGREGGCKSCAGLTRAAKLEKLFFQSVSGQFEGIQLQNFKQNQTREGRLVSESGQ